MNIWLALDIEQKRTRAAGGMRAHAAAEFELDALLEAWRTYARLEADSNELAIAMFDRLTATHSIDVRARAFAGQGCALAQRARLFGEPLERSRPMALSAAKGALLADPKLPMRGSPWRWPSARWMTARRSTRPRRARDGDRHDPRAAAAGPSSPPCTSGVGCSTMPTPPSRSRWSSSRMDVHPSDRSEPGAAAGRGRAGMELLHAAVLAAPHHANILTCLALALKAKGMSREAEDKLAQAMELTNRDCHRLLIRAMYDQGRFPF